MEPASSIIRSLGGVSAIVDITGVHRTRVYSWMRGKTEGGTGGVIPQKHIPTLLNEAKAKGLELSADDFLPSPTQEREAS
jgi:hypothetical protein